MKFILASYSSYMRFLKSINLSNVSVVFASRGLNKLYCFLAFTMTAVGHHEGHKKRQAAHKL